MPFPKARGPGVCKRCQNKWKLCFPPGLRFNPFMSSSPAVSRTACSHLQGVRILQGSGHVQPPAQYGHDAALVLQEKERGG